jgi:integrase
MKSRKRTLPVADETLAGLLEQREHFRAKFGREPGPEDPLFFDPDSEAATPQPFPVQRAQSIIADAMQAAGVHPRLVHAFRRTGLLVSEDNIELVPEQDLAAWQAALEEWDALQERSN